MILKKALPAAAAAVLKKALPAAAAVVLTLASVGVVSAAQRVTAPVLSNVGCSTTAVSMTWSTSAGKPTNWTVVQGSTVNGAIPSRLQGKGTYSASVTLTAGVAATISISNSAGSSNTKTCTP